MADVKFLSLAKLQQYDGLIKNYIKDADAKAYKTIIWNATTEKIEFYKKADAVSGTDTPDVEIAIAGTDVANLKAAVGDLTTLTTTAKTNLVAAINELKSAVDNAAVTVSVAESATDGYLKTYVIKQGTSELGKIDIPKDLVVTSGEIVTAVNADDFVTGSEVGDKFIKLTIANQEAPIYINVKDLVDIYTVASSAAEVQLAVSESNELSATLVDKGVAKAKLVQEVQNSLDKIDSFVEISDEEITALFPTEG